MRRNIKSFINVLKLESICKNDMFTQEQIISFIMSVELGSFSAAARHLKKSQSVISQNIINMEIDCGQVLFDRSRRYPQLTKAGASLLPYMKAVMAQHQRLEQQVDLLEQQHIEKLTLAIDEGIPFSGVMKAIDSLSNEFPQIKIEFFGAASQDIIELVEQKRVDSGLIFCESQYPEKLDFESLGTVPFELLISAHHPLAFQTASSTDTLRLHRQLVIGSRNQLTSWFNQPHSPDIWYADNYYLLLEMTIAGLGWALLPRHIAQEAIDKGLLCYLPIEYKLQSWQANVDVIQHQSKSMEKVNRRLRQLLRNILE